jgi:hypothetical protein
MRCVLEVWIDDEDYYGARNHEAASKFFVQNLFGPDIGQIDPPAILEKLAEGARGHHGRVTSQSMTALCAPLCEGPSLSGFTPSPGRAVVREFPDDHIAFCDRVES